MLSYRFFHQLFSDPKGTFDAAMDSGPLKKAFFIIFFFSFSIALALILNGLKNSEMLLHKAVALSFFGILIASTLFFIILIPAIITLLGKIFSTEITFKKAVLAYVLPFAGYIPIILIAFVSILLTILFGENSTYLFAGIAPLIGAMTIITFIWSYYTSLQLLKHAFGFSLFASLWVMAAPFIIVFYVFILSKGFDHSGTFIKGSVNEVIEKIEKEENFIAGKIASEIGTENSEGMETSNPDIERYPPDNISEEVKNRPRDEFNISPSSDIPSE